MEGEVKELNPLLIKKERIREFGLQLDKYVCRFEVFKMD